jgi:hypothetical protein
MLGFGAIGQLALGEVPAAPTATPQSYPSAWQEPRQTLARKVVVGALVASISAGVFAPPVTPKLILPLPTGAIWITKAVPTQFAFNQITAAPQQILPPWSEPVRPRRGLPAALQQAAAQYTPAPVVVASQPYPPWSEPSRTRKHPAALQPATASPVATPSFVRAASWSEPRRGKGLLAALQQPAALAYTVTPVAQNQSWLRPPWGPVISIKAIPAQFAFNPPAVIADATASQPYPPWPEPRRERGFLAALQQSVAQYTASPVVVAVSQPYPPWAEPRRGRGLLAALQQSAAQYTASPVVVAVAQPYSPWSEPRRSGPRQAFYQQSVAHFTTSPVAVSWLTPWAEPSRAKKRPPPLQLTTAAPTPAPSFALLAPWSEPRRLKPLRITPPQNFHPYVAAPAASNFSQWYANLSEPQRQRVGLKTWLQSTTALAATPTTLTATMAATETNSDRAQFVYIVTRAVASAKVSIIEGPLAAAAASLRES